MSKQEIEQKIRNFLLQNYPDLSFDHVVGGDEEEITFEVSQKWQMRVAYEAIGLEEKKNDFDGVQ